MLSVLGNNLFLIFTLIREEKERLRPAIHHVNPLRLDHIFESIVSLHQIQSIMTLNLGAEKHLHK